MSNKHAFVNYDVGRYMYRFCCNKLTVHLSLGTLVPNSRAYLQDLITTLVGVFTYLFYTTLSSDYCKLRLSAAYIIAKLSVDSILDNNQKTPIICGKYHMVHDVTILLS